MSENHEGFTNSATCLAVRYLKEGMSQRIQSMRRRVPLRADTIELVVAATKVRKADVEDHLICGVVGNTLYLDSWAEGNVDWQEVAKAFHS